MKANLLLLLFILGGIACLSMFGFQMNSFFMPKYRQLENETFKQSEQYNDGMIRDLENLRMEYVKSTSPEQKEVIKQTILHRFSVYSNTLPYELKAFYNSLRNE